VGQRIWQEDKRSLRQTFFFLEKHFLEMGINWKRTGAVAQTTVFCGVILLPVILFFVTTGALFFTINPMDCSPSVVKGKLPAPAQEVYGVVNANATSWYYNGIWNVFPTRGVCPVGAKTGVTIDKKTGKQVAGDYKSCLGWGSSDWATIDKYNAAAGAPTLVNTSTAFHVSYQAIMVAIVVSCVLILVACCNIFLSINSLSGRHNYFSLLLVLEVLCYFIVFLLACIIVGGPASSSMADPKAWSVWFPTCNVVIEEKTIPSIMYWLIFMTAFVLSGLVVGELVHRQCDKCLTKKIALPGTITDEANHVDGGKFGDSGFTKAVADWRARTMRIAFFVNPATSFTTTAEETETGNPATENNVKDRIPRRFEKGDKGINP